MEFSFDESAEYTDRAFKRIKLPDQMIKGKTFDTCKFIDCTFQGSIFQNCKFRDCTFHDCNLRLMRVPGSSFRETTFHDSNVSIVNWVEGAWSKAGLLDSIGFMGCDVSDSTFIGLELKKMVLSKCNATNADFAEANLTQANLSHTDFSDSRFLHTNLTEADLTHALNYAIDVTLNTIKKAKFSLPEAVNLLRCMNIVLVE